MSILEPFKMKQFEVAHDQCAMRVNTDGCLIGAAAGTASMPNPKRILDIGTGSGVIALQLAQRFPSAYVDAVDIHGPSARQAMENFAKSPFSDRLVCYHQPIQEFDLHEAYDLIVSNPPYFESGPTKSDIGVAQARHALTLDFQNLIQHSARLLNDRGELWVILPCDRKDAFLEDALEEGMFLKEVISIRPKDGRPANRCMFGLSKNNEDSPVKKEWILYNEQGTYGNEVQEALRPFYLSLI